MRFLWCFAALLFFVPTLSRAEGESLIHSPIQKVFVPNGFDNNDNIEIVVSGNYPNTCYKTGPSLVEIDFVQKIISLTPQSFKYHSPHCADAFVSFVQTIAIGSLPEGEYKIKLSNSPAMPMNNLIVKPRFTESPDDYLYAPVDSAYLEYDPLTKQNFITLAGEYPEFSDGGCASLENVQFHLSPGPVLVVLPILSVFSDCETTQGQRRFIKKVLLPDSVPGGSLLIHVRVLNGNSLNRLTSVVK